MLLSELTILTNWRKINMSVTESDLSQLELQDESYGKQVSIEEKKALIAQAKKHYGKDYIKFFSKFTSGSSGIDWNMLRFRMQ